MRTIGYDYPRILPNYFCGLDLNAKCEWCGDRWGLHELDPEGLVDPVTLCWQKYNLSKYKRD